MFRKKKKDMTDHANVEGNGPQHSKEQGWGGSTGPPQPERQGQRLLSSQQRHHRSERLHGSGEIHEHRALISEVFVDVELPDLTRETRLDGGEWDLRNPGLA